MREEPAQIGVAGVVASEEDDARRVPRDETRRLVSPLARAPARRTPGVVPTDSLGGPRERELRSDDETRARLLCLRVSTHGAVEPIAIAERHGGMTELARAGHDFFRLRSTTKKRERRPREKLDEQGMDKILIARSVSSHTRSFAPISMEHRAFHGK